jgi:hypothetical protein
MTKRITTNMRFRWRCSKGHVWEAVYGSVQQGTWCPFCNGGRVTIEDCHAVAKKHGGKCLSETYTGYIVPIEWECSEGHRWKTTPQIVVKLGCWCPACAGVSKASLEECQALARKRGGKCLSKKYPGRESPMKWECSKSHRWTAKFGNVKNGTWCPQCGGRARKTLRDCQTIAKKRGGACLSTEYVNCKTKMLWRCGKGHKWEAVYNDVRGSANRRGRWCPYCAGKHVTIADCQEVALKHNGECLSNSYDGDMAPMKWRCHKKHEWTSPFHNVKKGSWCPHCAGKHITLGECQVVAKKFDGRCLSTKYTHGRTLMRWECNKGHRWSASFSNTKRGHWCPTCARQKAWETRRKNARQRSSRASA